MCVCVVYRWMDLFPNDIIQGFDILQATDFFILRTNEAVDKFYQSYTI